MAYYLGSLTGGSFYQYANAAGQSYYLNKSNNTTSYTIPLGYEDHPDDTWTSDTSQTWPQWKNSRTGRLALINPRPPPPRSYLDIDNVKAAIDLLEGVPESDEHVYRRPTGGMLRFMFPESEGYEVVPEARGDVTLSDFCTYKVLRKPGGTLYQYDFLHTEVKPTGESWRTTEVQHREQLAGTGNESKQCYGSIQIGLEFQFYKLEGKELEKIGGRMHMKRDHENIIAWSRHLKANPLPVV